MEVGKSFKNTCFYVRLRETVLLRLIGHWELGIAWNFRNRSDFLCVNSYRENDIHTDFGMVLNRNHVA